MNAPVKNDHRLQLSLQRAEQRRLDAMQLNAMQLSIGSATTTRRCVCGAVVLAGARVVEDHKTGRLWAKCCWNIKN